MKAKLTQFVCAVAVVCEAGRAEAQGLARARSVLQNFQGELLTIVPVIAVISLIVLAVLWATKVIRFHSLVQWGAGVVLVGCASQLVSMLMG
jgi:type IV secretory pathway VirB2 component (pilin)